MAPGARAPCSDANIDKWEIRNQAEPQKAWFGQRHIIFALRLAARHLGQSTIQPAEYKAARRELIEANRRRARRHDHEALLERLLPTIGQVERIVRNLRRVAQGDGDRDPDRLLEVLLDVDVDVDDQVDRDRHDDHHDQDGDDDHDLVVAVVDDDEVADDGDEEDEVVVVDDRRRRHDDRPAGEEPAGGRRRRGGEWDEALEMAELRPRAELLAQRREQAIQRGMPVALAIHHFLEVHGVDSGWPGSAAVSQFARLAETALADIKPPWPDHLKAARDLRTERGLPGPPGLKATRRRRDSVQAPTEPLEGAVPRREQQPVTREAVLADLRTYDEKAPAGRRTWHAYRAYAVRRGLIAASAISRVGPFQELLKEARRQTSGGVR